MAQSLIEQLQLGAVDGSAPITDLLRKAKLAAVKLNVSDFAAWVDLEMTGYVAAEIVPPYRIVRGALKFLNPIRGWQPIFGMERLEQDIRQPISELFTLSQSDAGYVTVTVPEEFRERVAQEIGFQCDVRIHVGTATLGGIVEAVRNNVLGWTVKLEKAGIYGHGLSFTAAETKAAQAMQVTNNYHGPVASVSHGTVAIQSIAQSNSSATPLELADAVASLIRLLLPGKSTDDDTSDAVSDLAAAEPELREGRLPLGKIGKALNLLRKTEDIAVRAPEVAARVHELAQMFGLV